MTRRMHVYGIVGGSAKLNWTARTKPPARLRNICCWGCGWVVDRPAFMVGRGGWDDLDRALLLTALFAAHHQCDQPDVRLTILEAFGLGVGRDDEVPLVPIEAVLDRYEELKQARAQVRAGADPFRSAAGQRLSMLSGHNAPRRLLKWTRQMTPVAIKPPAKWDPQFLNALRGAEPPPPRTPKQLAAVLRRVETSRWVRNLNAEVDKWAAEGRPPRTGKSFPLQRPLLGE